MIKKVAYQGEPGAYSEAAALEYFGDRIEVIPCELFEDVFDQVNQGEASHGIIPIENSLAGSIHGNYDQLLKYKLGIIGEYYFRVQHCLMALPGVRLDDIERVHSHPQALAQCEKSLTALGVKRVVEVDTAGSARLISEKQDNLAGVLASERAAEVYGLTILKENMEDNRNNYTRFLVLSPTDVSKILESDDEDYKTSLVFNLVNKPGALFNAMSVFALREIDLTKIESRPNPEKIWDYLFYIDFVGHVKEEKSKRALAHLAEIAPFMRVLGSYPRHIIE